MQPFNLNFGALTDAAAQVPTAFSNLLSSFGSSSSSAPTAGATYQVPAELLEKMVDLQGQSVSKVNPMLQNVGAGIGALGGLAQIYASLKGAKLAAKDFDFQKKAYNNQLEASTKGYNTALMDRANNRGNQYGDAGYATNYYNENRLAPSRA